MRRISFSNISFWQFDHLARERAIRHFVSERTAADGTEFSLSFSSSPDRNLIESNRMHLAAAMGVPASKVFFPSQVHKTRIVEVTASLSREALMETDALITSEHGVCIGVMSADCVPVLIYDRRNGAIAAVHAGWRGTVARIVEKTLHRMHTRYGTRGEDIIAGIGPSVSRQSYEVGADVVDAVEAAFRPGHGLLTHTTPGKALLDLWKANQTQLTEFGVSAASIEVSNLCTVKDNDLFFSARKGDRGRFGAGIMLARRSQ